MFSLLVDIKNKEATKNLDSEFAGYESKLDKIAKRNFSTDEVKDRELRRIKAAFEGIQGLRKLGALEEEDLKSINEVLNGTRQIPDKKQPTSDLDEANLGKKIEDDIGKYAKKTNKTNFDALMSHLNDQGDGLDGENKSDYADAADDTKKDEVWKKFIEKGSEVVYKTIVAHEFEAIKNDDNANKKKKLKEMEDAKSGDNKLDLTKYDNKDGKFTDKGLRKYIYEERIGKPHEYTTSQQDTPTSTDEDKGKA
ncbi:26960_t:CDS:2 [Gigaspora margarita]|uniref:26960_t:CDS:1 n=1 Tax=Gigaspora margarita TaxID=4874 RepID=A0ABN7WBR0_GIGMA|nr:26960_t:CDS:2 [Gigaspora margarita]